MSDNKSATDKPADKPAVDRPTEKKSSPHTKVYEDVGTFLEALHAERGHTWPLTDEQLRAFVGDVAWVKIVNHERAEHDQEPLERHEALSVRPKLFDKSWTKKSD